MELGWAIELPGQLVYSEVFVRLGLASLLILAIPLPWIIRRFLRRLAASRARQSVGDEVGALDRSLDSTGVVVRGRLVGHGDLVESFCGIEPVLATTVAAATLNPPPAMLRRTVNCSGTQLRLDVDGALVDLEGPLEVLLGSREQSFGPLATTSRLGARLADIEPEARFRLGRAPLVGRSLTGGDEVLVEGILNRRPSVSRHESYRRAAEHWVLEGVPDPKTPEMLRAPLVALYAGRPVHRRRPLFQVAATGAAVASVALAYWIASGYHAGISQIWW